MKQEIKRHFDKAKNDNNWDGFADFNKIPIPQKFNDSLPFVSASDFFNKGWENKDLFSNSPILFKVLNILNEEISSMTKEDEGVVFEKKHFIFSFYFC